MLLSEIDRQIFNVWRNRWQKKNLGAPRIAVVGNCQSFGVAYGMKLLNPSSSVDRFTIVRKGMADLKLLAKTLEDYDHVFALEFQPGFLRGGGCEELQQMLPEMSPIPTIVFSGFHPDTIYILDPTRCGRPIEGPTGPYHSAIALFAYLRGMSVAQTEALFCAELFQALGYFDVWAPAAEEFLALGRASNLDLSGDLVRWSRSGPFMYSVNHPKGFVLFDVAKALLKRANMPAFDVDFNDYAVDDIVRGAVFPVYPEVAERYGHRGAYIFKKSNYRLSQTVGDFLNLRGYIEESFAVYARHERAQLDIFRMKNWGGDPEVGRLFDFYSADNLARRRSRP